MHYKNTLKSFRFPKPTQPRHLKLKTNLQQTTIPAASHAISCTKTQLLLSATGSAGQPFFAANSSALLMVAAVNSSNGQQVQPDLSSHPRCGRTPTTKAYIFTNLTKKEAENPVRVFIVNQKQQSGVSTSKHYQLPNFRRLMTRELVKERSQSM